MRIAKETNWHTDGIRPKETVTDMAQKQLKYNK
jgi:hypothetical protein